ncbi:MAG: hypothetical protein WKG07_31455 [Hymenobacter sp.]
MTVPLRRAIGAHQAAQVMVTYSYILNKGSHQRTGEVAPGAAFVAYFFPRIAVYDDIDGWNRWPYTGVAGVLQRLLPRSRPIHHGAAQLRGVGHRRPREPRRGADQEIHRPPAPRRAERRRDQHHRQHRRAPARHYQRPTPTTPGASRPAT